ncbi:MAG: hypothetical protein JNM14_12065 [Ferruginibacter sp.]|nr:hypothetical protein [Ferruginibacter sp.]
MNRRKFLSLAGASVVVVAGTTYLLSDRQHFVRDDIKGNNNNKLPLKPDEKEILYLASLAPSGHNTQPWIVKYLEPYHWIISNDKTKWLPAVDPTQRETILSIGAFIQNLEYAAAILGYSCEFSLLALNNQDEDIIEAKLKKTTNKVSFDTKAIKLRRTVRSGYMKEPLKKEHVAFLTGHDKDYFHFFSNNSKEYCWLNEQTIEANRQQTFRDAAQSELADWMRLSSKEAKKYCDGLTTASMEINGMPGWVVRNFYSKKDVMGKKFREQGLDKVKEQVGSSGGWLLITSKDNSASTLIETGKRLQRMLLKTREKSIAIHPMTQILEEAEYRNELNQSIGISNTVQFILRAGYVKNYPDPVSLRRPVERFVKIQ